MRRLSVNLNKIALLGNSRTLGIPSVIRAAVHALVADALETGLAQTVRSCHEARGASSGSSAR